MRVTRRWLVAAMTTATAAAAGGAGDSDPVVSASWLADARRQAGNRIVIAEVSWAPANKAREYNSGHIPGAIHIDTDVFENGSPRWHLRPAGELHAAIGALGIAPDATVVVYSHQAVTAARAWWILEYAGAAEVRYLDGGLAAWKRAGQPVETAPAVLPPVRFAAPVREHMLATTDHVRQRLKTAILADVRSGREYRGEVSGYSYLDARGRIPGAAAAGDAGDRSGLYRNPDGTLRGIEEVRRRWREAGILNDGREVIFYCGSGWRSSLAFLYARRIGLRNVRNYSDGWSGWSTTYTQDGGTAWRQKPSPNPVVRGGN